MEVTQDYDLKKLQALNDTYIAQGLDPEESVNVPPASDGTEAAKLTFQEDGTIRYSLGHYNSFQELPDKTVVKSGFVSNYSVVYTKEGS